MLSEKESSDQILDEVYDFYIVYKEFFKAPFSAEVAASPEKPANKPFRIWVSQQQTSVRNLLNGLQFFLDRRFKYFPERKLEYETTLSKLYLAINQLEVIEEELTYSDEEDIAKGEKIKIATQEVEKYKTALKQILSTQIILSEDELFTLKKMTGMQDVITRRAPISASIADYIYHNQDRILSVIRLWYQYLGPVYANCFANRTYVNKIVQKVMDNKLKVTANMLTKIETLDEELPPDEYKEKVTTILSEPDDELSEIDNNPYTRLIVDSVSPHLDQVIDDLSENNNVSELAKKNLLTLKDELQGFNPNNPNFHHQIFSTLISALDKFNSPQQFTNNFLSPIVAFFVTTITDIFGNLDTPNVAEVEGLDDTLMFNLVPYLRDQIINEISSFYTLSILKIMVMLQTLSYDSDSLAAIKKEFEILNQKIGSGDDLFSTVAALKTTLRECLEKIQAHELGIKNQLEK